MFRFPSLRFKSITHRLIFACLIAAIVIYSLSFWNIRQITKRGALSWMIQVAQARVNSVAAEVEGILQSTSKNASFVFQAVDNQGQDLQEKSQLLQGLMDQQLTIQTVALQQSSLEALGLERSSKGYSSLNLQRIKALLKHCPSFSSTHQTVWSSIRPDNSNPQLNKAVYCLHGVAKPNVNSSSILAVEINFNWVNTLVKQKLEVIDQFNQLTIGHPWFIDLKTQEWFVPPAPEMQHEMQQLSWLSDLSNRIKLSKPVSNDVSQSPLNLTPAQVFSEDGGTVVITSLPSTSWSFGIAFTQADLNLFLRKYLLIIIASMGRDMVLMCIAIVITSRQTTHSLRALIMGVEEIAQGHLDTALPIINQQDEVGRLGRSFRHMQDSLKAYIEKLKTTTSAKQKLESELKIASQIQQSMLPKTDVSQGSDQRYHLSSLHQPARIVGGDLYDFFLLGSDRLCVLIGDVADKGVPAALLIARTVTLIRIVAKQAETPTDILQAVNQELCVNNDECLFVTLFCGILDLPTGLFHCASGGHDPPIIVHNHLVKFLDLETGPPLGLEEDAIFPDLKVFIQPNNLLLLYTDGITEAMNPQGDFFSDSRLLETIACYPPSSPSRAVRTIQHFHRQFVTDADQSDDLTLLALQYLPLSPFPKDMATMEWQITINSEITELDRVKQRLGKILQEKNLNLELIEDTQLIAEEILVNIATYGYTDQPINLQVRMSQNTLIMIFEDFGKPFNPLTEIPPVDLAMDDEERSMGGLGFYMVRELADRLDYAYQGGKNILTVTRNIS